MKERKALGKGIASLIPSLPSPDRESPTSAWTKVGEEKTPGDSLLEIQPQLIRLNPRQPRRHFSEAALEELTESIRRLGILEPLLVRKTDTGFELIAGERRLRAAKRAGVRTVPAIIRSGNDQSQLVMALVENLQREDLNPMEEARGYDQLAREFSLTQEEVAKRVGKERSTVANLVRLLKLPSSVQEMIGAGKLSMGHARAMLPIEHPRRQEELARKIEKEDLSVRQVETLVRKMLGTGSKKGRRVADQTKIDPNLRYFSEEIQRKLGTKVDIIPRGKGGEIRLSYYNPDDFKRLSERLMKS